MPGPQSATKRQIMTALAARISALNLFATVETNKIRIMASDFGDHELPGCQLIGIAEEPQHHHNRILRSWVIHIEIVMKSTENGVVTQYDLWDMQQAVESQLGGQAQLKDVTSGLPIPGFLDINYRGSVNDLHMEEPYYTARMEVLCRFYTDYTGSN